MSSWATLRQVVIATTSHETDVAAVRTAFGLGEGITDPELKTLFLDDATLTVSPGRYIEFVGPNDPSAAVVPWLTKIGGRGGYVLSVQHPDPDAVRERAKAAGVRISVDTEAFGKTVLQLHPKDVGLLLEVDGIAEPAAWFWDDMDPGPEPGASIDAIVAVEVPVADPAAMTTLWAGLLDVPAAGADELDLGGITVRFVAGGPSADWTVLLRRTGGGDGERATEPDLAGITFRLV